jgi:hypothetical protein
MSSHPVMIEGVVLMKATKNKIFENESERHVACSIADPDPHVLGLPDPDPLVRGTGMDRIRILLSSCKNTKKNLDSYYFVTFYLRKMM